MKSTSIEEQNIICNFYKSGKTGVEISEILNKNIKTVYKILKKFHLTKSSSECKKIYSINNNYFDNIKTPRQAYWLGFISGDGCIINNKLIINLSVKDKLLLEQFNCDLNSNNPIHTYKNFVNLTINSEHLTKKLSLYNIVSNKTKLFQLSDKIPDNLINSYILGLFDADGCFSVDKTRGLRFSLVGTQSAMEQVQNILIEKSGVNKNKLQNHHTTNYIKYLVYSGNKQLRKIIDLIYKGNDFYLLRKYEIVKNYFNLQ